MIRSLSSLPCRNLRLSLVLSRRCFSSQKASGSSECDVVIIGGGPVGLALASALGASKVIRESLRIVLVEAGDLSQVRDWTLRPGTFSNRVSSLTTTSQVFLKDIGVWGHVDITRTSPIEEMQVWDGVSDARITFSASGLGLDVPGTCPMAVLTENFNLQRGLLRHLNNVPEVKLLDSVKVDSIQGDGREGGTWPVVHLSDGRKFRTRLLVGADGFNSPVRSYAGISSYGWSYDAQAIVATLSHRPRAAFQIPNTVAYQRFLPTGPIAFLPLSPTESSLVWSTKSSLAHAFSKAKPAVLVSMINAAFRLPAVSMHYLHKCILEAQAGGVPMSSTQIHDEIVWRERSHTIDAHSAYASASATHDLGIPPEDSESLPPLVTSIQPGSIASFPLRFNHAESYIGEGLGGRTVLVGDAAHTVHPLAGQGLNMGLADVECLAQCILKAVVYGGDVGSYTALLPYSRKRYFENHKLMASIDKLHKLYSTTFEPVVWARSVGLEVLNELDSVKAAMMMAAGAGSRRSIDEHRGPTVVGASGWTLAATGVEGLVSGMSAAKLVGVGIAGALEARLRGLLRTTSGSQGQPK